MKKYFYPALSNRDYGWFRVGGPELVNCMFFAVNAYISASKSNRVGTLLQLGVSLVCKRLHDDVLRRPN